MRGSRWHRFREGVRHAFTTRPPELTEQERLLIDRVAEEVRRRDLTTAALTALEIARPVTGVAGHTLTFMQPVLGTVAQALGGGPDAVDRMARLLQNRGALEELRRRLEQD